MIPPPARIRTAPSGGAGMPAARCTRPAAETTRKLVPMPIRPFAAARSGWRIRRMPKNSRTSGSASPTRPSVPATTACTTSPKAPSTPHHSTAATTIASATRVNPSPSRRSSGSRSRVVRADPPRGAAHQVRGAHEHAAGSAQRQRGALGCARRRCLLAPGRPGGALRRRCGGAGRPSAGGAYGGRRTGRHGGRLDRGHRNLACHTPHTRHRRARRTAVASTSYRLTAAPPARKNRRRRAPETSAWSPAARRRAAVRVRAVQQATSMVSTAAPGGGGRPRSRPGDDQPQRDHLVPARELLLRRVGAHPADQAHLVRARRRLDAVGGRRPARRRAPGHRVVSLPAGSPARPATAASRPVATPERRSGAVCGRTPPRRALWTAGGSSRPGRSRRGRSAWRARRRAGTAARSRARPRRTRRSPGPSRCRAGGRRPRPPRAPGRSPRSRPGAGRWSSACGARARPARAGPAAPRWPVG